MSYERILNSLGPKGLSELNQLNREIIIQAFRQNLVLKEFNQLNKSLQDRRYFSKNILEEQ